MNKLSLTVFAACASIALFTGSASAEIHNFAISLDPAQVTASPGARTGTGTGTAAYDDVSGIFSWMYTFSGLSGTPTLAHFHGPAAPGINAGVQVPASPVSPAASSAPITAGQAADLLADLWYLNIHSSTFGGGEIRGQVLLQSTVPEPTSAALLGMGALGVLFVRRRMR